MSIKAIINLGSISQPISEYWWPGLGPIATHDLKYDGYLSYKNISDPAID